MKNLSLTRLRRELVFSRFISFPFLVLSIYIYIIHGWRKLTLARVNGSFTRMDLHVPRIYSVRECNYRNAILISVSINFIKARSVANPTLAHASKSKVFLKITVYLQQRHLLRLTELISTLISPRVDSPFFPLQSFQRALSRDQSARV